MSPTALTGFDEPEPPEDPDPVLPDAGVPGAGSAGIVTAGSGVSGTVTLGTVTAGSGRSRGELPEPPAPVFVLDPEPAVDWDPPAPDLVPDPFSDPLDDPLGEPWAPVGAEEPPEPEPEPPALLDPPPELGAAAPAPDEPMAVPCTAEPETGDVVPEIPGVTKASNGDEIPGTCSPSAPMPGLVPDEPPERVAQGLPARGRAFGLSPPRRRLATAGCWSRARVNRHRP